MRSGVNVGVATISGPNVLNERRGRGCSSSAALAWRKRMSTFSSSSRMLASTSTRAGAGKRSAPRSWWQPAQRGVQRRRPRGPDQPVAIVEGAEQPLHRPRPALGGVRAVLGGAERVVGDEHLAPRCGSKAACRSSGRGALVGLPAVGHLGQGDHARDRGLAHLGRPGEHGEAVLAQGPHARGRRRGWARTRAASRSASPRSSVERSAAVAVDERVEVAHAQQRRHGQAQLGPGVDARAQRWGVDDIDASGRPPRRGSWIASPLAMSTYECRSRSWSLCSMDELSRGPSRPAPSHPAAATRNAPARGRASGAAAGAAPRPPSTMAMRHCGRRRPATRRAPRRRRARARARTAAGTAAIPADQARRTPPAQCAVGRALRASILD